jgi:CHASE3 domain sensor protein
MRLLFGAAVFLLLLSALAAYDAVTRFRASQMWVSHSRDIQSALGELNNACARAGRARTRYVDTGDDNFLQDYLALAADIPARLNQLRQSIDDNREQQYNWKQLQGVTNRRLALLNRSVELKRASSPDIPEQARLRQEIIDVSAKSDSLFEKMQSAEQELLDARRLHSERLFQVTGYILCGAFILALALFFFHYRLLNVELVAREQAEESLRSLSVRLLELQDQERRKFSRELHDSLGQYLVGVKMNLAMLENSIPTNSLVAESMALLDDAMTETRTISCILRFWTKPVSPQPRAGTWKAFPNAAAFPPAWMYRTILAVSPSRSSWRCFVCCRKH